MNRKKVELLAPAGNAESFYGAIHAGADAVYLGGDKFGARAYAENFASEELAQCIRYAHIFGRKVYLTVNTLIKDSEWGELYGYILPFYEAGLDGVIVQDFGVLLYLKEHFPDLELHASTQMTLSGLYGASCLEKLGVRRIVPSRELSLEEIKEIKKNTGLEIEVFIHGAMCYCYSGQCLFSSILGGRSGNRGRCAQPCRLPYRVEPWQDTPCYPLSLKDMCAVENIGELIGAGIDSFKIEGRMKKPEYAAGATAVYRRVIDRYYEDPERFRVFSEDLSELSKLYVRSELQSGYFHKHNGADMVTLQNPGYTGSSDRLTAQIRERYLGRKLSLPVGLCASFKVGEAARLNLRCGSVRAEVTGERVQPAKNRPVRREEIERQLQKLGGTCFYPDKTQIDADENIFYSLRDLNVLRRDAVAALEREWIAGYGLSPGRKAPEQCRGISSRDIDRHKLESKLIKQSFTVSVRTVQQLCAVMRALREGINLRRVYADADMVVDSIGQLLTDTVKILSEISSHTQVFLALPYIVRHRDEKYMEILLETLSENHAFCGCMVRSLEGYAWLDAHGYTGPVSSDAGFYIWNRATLVYWQEKLDTFCLPWELSAAEQRSLLESGALPAEKIVYGRLPMMVSANCVLRTAHGCTGRPGGRISGSAADPYRVIYLTDRMNKKFPVAVNCTHCLNVIYNSVPLSLHDSVDRWRREACARLDFTVEDAEQTLAVLRYFDAPDSWPRPYEDYTLGHERRGVL